MPHVKWWGEEAKEMTVEGAIEGLFRGSEFLLAKANETVPIEEGILKDSGDTDVDGGDLVATVFYNTPYAARQHEDTTFHHLPGRRAKWLQLTMQEQVRPILDILKAGVKDKWKRGRL